MFPTFKQILRTALTVVFFVSAVVVFAVALFGALTSPSIEDEVAYRDAWAARLFGE